MTKIMVIVNAMMIVIIITTIKIIIISLAHSWKKNVIGNVRDGNARHLIRCNMKEWIADLTTCYQRLENVRIGQGINQEYPLSSLLFILSMTGNHVN